MNVYDAVAAIIVTDDVSPTPKETGYDREPAVFFRVCVCTCESGDPDPPPTFERACATRGSRDARLDYIVLGYDAAYNQSAGAAHP